MSPRYVFFAFYIYSTYNDLPWFVTGLRVHPTTHGTPGTTMMSNRPTHSNPAMTPKLPQHHTGCHVTTAIVSQCEIVSKSAAILAPANDNTSRSALVNFFPLFFKNLLNLFLPIDFVYGRHTTILAPNDDDGELETRLSLALVSIVNLLYIYRYS